jgi:hypothetical protein
LAKTKNLKKSVFYQKMTLNNLKIIENNEPNKMDPRMLKSKSEKLPRLQPANHHKFRTNFSKFELIFQPEKRLLQALHFDG